MAVTQFQARILKMLATNRIKEGETYVAGGLALNHQLHRPRVSHDIDVFSDTDEALYCSARADRETLKSAGLAVAVKRELPFMIEVTVSDGNETTDIQWAKDSAYRFFPLVEDDVLGVTLHPFDLATNKLLALACRNVPRDWIDMVSCSEVLQPLGLLAWAANGKDNGLTPRFILEMAAKVHYSQSELDLAILSSEDIDVVALSEKWRGMLDDARGMITLLPPDKIGTAVLNGDGTLFNGTNDALAAALREDAIVFHPGRICGAWPQIVR
jgi:hypothetical protein